MAGAWCPFSKLAVLFGISQHEQGLLLFGKVLLKLHTASPGRDDCFIKGISYRQTRVVTDGDATLFFFNVVCSIPLLVGGLVELLGSSRRVNSKHAHEPIQLHRLGHHDQGL